MARLRKPSPMDIVFTAPSDTKPKRSSPRKAAHDVSYIMSDDEDENLSFIPKSTRRGHRYATSQDIDDSFQVPRMSAIPEPMTPRRQRALRPVESNNRLLRKLSDDTLASPEKSKRRVRSRSPGAEDLERKKNLMYARRLARSVVKKQGVKGRIDVIGAAEVLASTPSKKEEEVTEVEVEVEDEMETSLLCGDADDMAQEQANNNFDDGSSHERSSESPSTEGLSAEESDDDDDDDEPVVAVRPQQRRPQIIRIEDSESESDEDPSKEKQQPLTSTQTPPRKAKSPTSNSGEVIDLTNSPEAPSSFDIPLTHTRTTSFASSRPTTSGSDAPLAILTYSPTPTKKRSPCKAPPVSRPITPPVLSANPSKLVSPSKKKPLAPAPDLRPSLDAFWNPEVVHDWHDRQSPAKPLVSPKKQKWREDITKMMDGIALDDESSSEEAPPSPVISPKKKKTPAPKKETASVEAKEARSQRKDFATNKHAIATAFLEELDSTICSGAIAELTASTGGIKLVWSKTLKTTAGRANWRREQTRVRTGSLPTDVRTETRHHCSIELAEKVIDDAERLYNVLAHEFCHLTTFMLSNVRNNPHGAEFKSWGRKATTAFADRGVTVTTKHSYAIEYKYVWECVECGYEFKRHSKSIDPARHSCGKCKGVLAQTKPVPRAPAKGADGATKPKNEYQLFVKENFKRVKSLLEARGEDAQMGKVMEAVAREYRAAKEEREREKAKAKVESADGLEAALDGLKI